MAIASVLFSLMSLFARLSAEDAPWPLVAAVRAWGGVAVASLVARAAGHSLTVNNQRIAWGRSLFGCVGMACSFYTMGSPDIALGDIAALRATVPLLVALWAALFLAEQPTPSVYVAMPIAFIGVVVLVQPSLATSGHLAFVALLGSVFSSWAMLFLRRLGPYESAEAVAIHFGVVAGVFMTFLAFWDGGRPGLWGLLYSLGAAAAGGLGQLCMTRAYARERAASVSAMGYLAVVLTHLAAFVVLDEPISLVGLLGALLVIGGGLILVLGRNWRLAAE